MNDQEIDPAVAAQLYGDVAPPIAEAHPAYEMNPWDWVPDHWNDGADQVGPGAASSAAVQPHQETPPPVAPPVMMDPTPEAMPPDPLAGSYFDPASMGIGAPSAPPPGVIGPALPPPPEPLAGSLFDPGQAPPPPADQAPVPVDAAPPAPAAPPPIPYGAAPLPSEVPAPAPAPVTLGPQLPQRPAPPVQTPYGWDPLSGSLFASPHIDPNAEDPFAGVSPATGYADAQDLAQNDRATFLQLQLDQQKRKALKESADRVRIDEEDVRQLKLDQSVRQAADVKTQRDSDQIVADAQKLAQTPLDRGRWFRNQSTLGKITTVLAAIVGGLMSKPGGPNLGIDYLNKHIDDDIADQKADIENRRGGLAARQTAVAQEFARTGNLFQAAETVRLAVRQAAVNKLQTEQQNFEPGGTTYLDYGKAIQGVTAGMAQQMEQTRKTAFAENAQLIKLQMEGERDAETRREHMAAEALARQKAAGAGKEKETSYSPEQLKILNPSATTVPPIPMTQTEFTKWQGTQKGGEELATAKRANDPNERNRELGVPGIVDDKGNIAHFKEGKSADAADTLGVADDIVRMTDELIGMVEKNGYSTDFARSPEWQKAQQTYAALLLTAKERDHLGALSGSDIELEQKKIGSSDPTQIRNTVAGMKQFRHNTIEAINSKFRNAVVLPSGRTLQRWDPKPPVASAPDETKLGGKTLAEHIDEAKPGRVTKAVTIPGVREALSVFPGYARPEDYARNAANIPVGPTGLALDDTVKVGGAIQAYATAPPAAQAAIVDQLKVWANSDRPSVATGVLGLIQGDNPALYERVLSQMPEDVQKQRREFDAVRGQLPGANLPPAPKPRRQADSPRDE